jgi:hypothetical protein
MSDFLSGAGQIAGAFQDVLGSGSLTNGAAMVRQAASGKINGTNFKITVGSLGGISAIKNRVYLKIPQQYFNDGSKLQVLSEDQMVGWGGIYFPVTPSIKQDFKANWNAATLTHNNYAVYSYQNSDVGQISISGQFPVQSYQEGFHWLATIHALKALTKMRTGNDVLAGAPPPVCRFYAYGPDMYDGVPVVVSGFNIDLPADVDYITTYTVESYEVRIPVLSTISLTLIPVYSRREMSRFSVDAFVRGQPGTEGFL